MIPHSSFPVLKGGLQESWRGTFRKEPAKAPAANPAIKKAAAPAGPEKKEEKATKAAEQDKPKMKQGNPGKEKELKSPAATKDKDSLKGKNPKNPEGSREKDSLKRKEIKASSNTKEKDLHMPFLTSATFPKANTTNSVTLNIHDKTLTFCQKSVTLTCKVASSVHVGSCASLNLSLLTMISDMSHTSGRQFEKSLYGEKYSRNFVAIAL
ncbi:hypothetical protein WISP_117659 [Willisornis vidua]|uniref:Uncharacterized protein n=1 Tax=Willisornis vidua TaxID=1566151 RepID=A0ABQ9CWH8_9PASS|nr:hypothetical protein WISP_117659 [Willisornis vidua]